MCSRSPSLGSRSEVPGLGQVAPTKEEHVSGDTGGGNIRDGIWFNVTSTGEMASVLRTAFWGWQWLQDPTGDCSAV